MVVHSLDAELVRRFKQGDAQAFASIVERYQDRVFTLAFRWLGDRAVAEEVAQDVFLALYRSLDSFRGDAKLSTWIYRVVVNHCKNKRLYRSRRKEDRHEPLEGTRAPGDDGPERQLPADQPDADAATYTGEAEALVQQALLKLDEEQRAIIVMRDLQDLSYEEIADLLGLQRGTVKSRLHRARAQLAAILSERIDLRDVW